MTLGLAVRVLSVVLVGAALGCDGDGENLVDMRTDTAGNGSTVVCDTPTTSGSATSRDPGLRHDPSVLKLLNTPVTAETAPPPISGGTLMTTADASTVVAADPDRDQLYFLDASSRRQLHSRALRAGDEPGRVIEDAAGRIHVVLRGAGAIATLKRDADSELTRREVCAVPRGIAYDATRDEVHVACAEGKLVSLGAAPTGQVTRELDLAPDLRDVLVRGEQIFVTRFRAAEMLVIDAQGVVQETRTPMSYATTEGRTVVEEEVGSTCGKLTKKSVRVEARPNVAWRAIDVPNTGVTMLHQRSQTEEILTTQGGYGGRRGCNGSIVQSALTAGVDTDFAMTGDLVDLTLVVDVATDQAGTMLAVVAPGNHGSSPQIRIVPLSMLQDGSLNANRDASSGVGAEPIPGQEQPTINGSAPCVLGTSVPGAQGQATAVTFVSANLLAVQEREPAAISFYNVDLGTLNIRTELGAPSREDTGHRLFHLRTSAGLACASCHPEAGDDGHVWTFAGIGPRRSQTLRGGILGTEPLHWNGDMQDFGMLMSEVFQGRMSGFHTSDEQGDALAHWLDRQPALHAEPEDLAAADRGKELFESEEVGCTQCHAGAHLTNNSTQDVGTGANLQVPSLKGVRFRTPLMHDGCAPTLPARFTNPQCGGGDNHGKTSHLTSDQLSELTAYLETL